MKGMDEEAIGAQGSTIPQIFPLVMVYINMRQQIQIGLTVLRNHNPITGPNTFGE
jgi:hypothetical protein